MSLENVFAPQSALSRAYLVPHRRQNEARHPTRGGPSDLRAAEKKGGKRNSMMNDAKVLDINGLMLRLPHRYPFLLVDRVLHYVSGESIRALKNVSYNEPFFIGHFPTRPLMPGVMIIEALAQ